MGLPSATVTASFGPRHISSGFVAGAVDYTVDEQIAKLMGYVAEVL